jgi:hypothetical protein
MSIIITHENALPLVVPIEIIFKKMLPNGRWIIITCGLYIPIPKMVHQNNNMSTISQQFNTIYTYVDFLIYIYLFIYLFSNIKK